MNKPPVFHAGCGGRITTAVINDKRQMVCQACDRFITDPMELTPRGSVFKKEPQSLPQWDAQA